MKLFNFWFFNQILQVYIFLLINISFVENAEDDQNCNGCKVDDNKKCVIDESIVGGKCENNCRPDLYNNNGKCYDCSNAFYTSQIYSIENESCKAKDASHCNKIIYDNNQCVNDCGSSMFEFGDYCYSNCNGNNKEEHEFLQNTCQCKTGNIYTFEDIAQDKKYLRCIESCPSGYFDARTKYCVPKCEGETDRINPDNSCTELCHDSFLFIQTEIINDKTETKKYCVSNCPNSAKFYYDNGIEKECQTECNSEYYSKVTTTDQITKYECLDSCDGTFNNNNFMILIDVNENIRQCTNLPYTSSTNYICGGEGEAKDFPYQYNNYCLRDCKDTQDIFQRITFRVNDNLQKFCSEECKEVIGDISRPFLDLNTLSCYQECSETSNKFYFANECINSCEIKNIPYHLDDTGECVYLCPSEYHLLEKEKTCYKECPKDSEYKYINEYNKCDTCDISQGYIYEDNQILYCKKSCIINSITIESNADDITTNLVTKKMSHKVDDNKCFEEKCDQNNDEYKYSIGVTNSIEEDNPDIYICYKSCKDIPGDFLYEYNNKCYKQKPSAGEVSLSTELEYYYIENGIFKYLKDEDTAKKECSKKGLYYLNKNVKECIKDCNSKDDYKTLYTLNEDGSIETFGECLDNCPEENTDNSEPNYFYSSEEKICYKQKCPYKTMFKVENGSPIKVKNEENCLAECNSNYPYRSKDGKACYDFCPNKFYIEINGKKMCVDSCDSNYYYFDGEYNCLNQCTKKNNKNESIFYYYNESNICLESCNTEDQSFQYAFEALQSHQPCLNECPFPYKYYEKDKLCISDCDGGFLEKTNSNKCVSSCGNGKFIINGNICSDNCTEEEPFYYPLIIKTDTMYKCTSNCKKAEKQYTVFEKDNNGFYQCLEICSKQVVYESECLNNCPEGLYQENGGCGAKCINKKYYEKNEDGGFYECKDVCNGENKYITSNNECKKYCPFGENFIGKGNKCKSFCSQEDGEYYKKLEDIHEDTKIYSIYKCVEKCSDLITYNTDQNGHIPVDNNIYILDETKECVSESPSDKIYYESEKDGEKIYYSLCLKDDNKPYSVPSTLFTSDPQKNECKEICPPNTYFGNDKICVANCKDKNNNKIINTKDNSCVNKCDLNSNYKYLLNDTSDPNDIKLKCVENCNGKKYSIYDYICVDKCTEPLNFVKNNQICDYACDEGQFANLNSENEYECKDSCDNNLVYYENENICYEDCWTGDYKIEYTNICVKSCDEKSTEEKKYYFYEPKDNSSPFKNNTCVTECPNDKPFKDINNHCIESCQDSFYKYYLPSDKKCLENCKDNYVKNEYECLLKCPYDKFEDENRNCIDSCTNSKGGNYYFYKSEKKCLKKCNDTDYISGDYECVSSCPENKFIDNKRCVDLCPSDKNYYIGIYLENGQQTLCLTDCQTDYPFFTFDNNNCRKCSSSCPTYYISNKDPYVNSKECVENCEGDYKYYIKKNKYKECLEICPIDRRYYISDLTSNIECLKECPPTHPYHKSNSFECLNKCDTNYAAYDVASNNKECVSSCEINDFWIKEKLSDNSEVTLCVKNCSDIDYVRFYTPERECVKICNSTQNLRGNEKKGICECISLFYFNDNGIVTCFDYEVQKCGEKNKDYPIQINGTNQCIKIVMVF